MAHHEFQLQIKSLHVSVDGKEILKGINLEISSGEIHALMGPNGSGKSTLSNAIMGNPKYIVTKGEMLFNGQNLLSLSADERAKLGIFMSFQYPSEIPGVSIANFLRTALNNVKSNKLTVQEFRVLLREKMELLKMDKKFAERYINDGFSGGEKKRSEILQMAVLSPALAILDETDSGLDIDSLKIVSDGVNTLMNKDRGILIITHYQRILNYIKPDFVHIITDGRIVKSGSHELAEHLEKYGYGWIGNGGDKNVSDL